LRFAIHDSVLSEKKGSPSSLNLKSRSPISRFCVGCLIAHHQIKFVPDTLTTWHFHSTIRPSLVGLKMSFPSHCAIIRQLADDLMVEKDAQQLKRVDYKKIYGKQHVVFPDTTE
jgi:hypothetical protein